jgi:exodeoxyribonuclease VII large subunit
MMGIFAAARGLPRPADVLAIASQRFDLAAGRLGAALSRNTSVHERDLVRVAARLTPGLLNRPYQLKAERLADQSRRLTAAVGRVRDHTARRARLPELGARMAQALRIRLKREAERTGSLGQLLASLNPDRPLQRGFARVHLPDGTLAHRAADLSAGDAVRLVFADGDRGAVVTGAAGGASPKPAKPAKAKAPAEQGDLF